MLRAIFFRTLVFLISLLLTGEVYAKVVTVVEHGNAAREKFMTQISELDPNDEVDVFYPDKKPLGKFIIQRFIEKGDMGRVYQAINESGKVVAIKFPTTDKDSLSYTNAEVRSLQVIENNKTPTVKVLRYLPGFFVEKEYISGGTLVDASDNWSKLSVEERSERLTGLIKFIETLQRGNIRISDLKAGNIIWDEDEKIWKVLDPGDVSKVWLGGSRGEDRFLAGIEKYGAPDLKEALRFALRNPEWIDRYIRLQNQVGRIKSLSDIGGALTFFRATQSPSAEAPAPYQMLWREGLARIALVTEQVHSAEVIECIVHDLRNSERN